MGVALLVLCLAVGGTAYAASQITGKQIKNGSITSADIKNKTLKSNDISKKAKKSLRGQTGPQGAQGVPGVAGLPGPSNAYSARRTDGSGANPASSTVVVKRLTLAAGKYTIISKMGIDDVSGAPKTAECQMLNGVTTVDSTFVTLSGAVAGGLGGFTCVNMAAVDLTAPTTTITIQVLTPAASQVRLGLNAVIMATKVGALTSTVTAGNG